MRFKTFLTAAAILAAGLACSAAEAQVRERNLRLGFAVNLDTFQGRGAKYFADQVNEKGQGKLKVTVFPAGTLGGDVQTVAALRGGTVDATLIATSIMVSVVKEFGLMDLPFVFESNAETAKLLDGPFGKKLTELAADKGLMPLAYWGAGFRNLTNSKMSVTKVEDMKGLKIRVLQAPTYIDLFNALGSNAVPMPFTEVYTALEQKTVDGQENPATTIVSAKLYEVQKFLSLTQHIQFASTLVFGKPTWDKLNADERKIITDAAAAAQAYLREAADKDETELMAKLKSSMTVNEIAPAEKARFRAAAKPVVDKYAAANDPELVKLLFSQLEQIRKK
ncbi:DctP family TRAP transporter solute-binding subunit [Ferrovibrio terrae]|uniref:DctP family TRAP transporter solute-binding subunit n=1 Tax=Ferrovibrio terrae TaxID=2594003 RepID=UPI0031378867